jgi:transcriptional regulator with XRE-family HTH domain
MYNLSNFGERLKELVYDNKITRIEDFCNTIEVGRTDFYRWWSNTTIPSVENTIKLANAFHCTIDFLIGRDEDNYSSIFNTVPAFTQQLHFIITEFHTNPHKLSKDAKISRASIYEWLNGTSKISLESLVKIAETLDCTIDYLIGRTN